MPQCPGTSSGAVSGHVTSSEFIRWGRAGSKRFPLACVRLSGRAGPRRGSAGSALPVARFCNGCGVSGTRATLPSRDGHPRPGALQGVWAQDRPSSPWGWHTCGAGMDPALPAGLVPVPGQTQLPWGAGTCGFRIDLSQLASLGQPTIPEPVKERFMTSLTLRIDESDGEGFLLRSQALKSPGFPEPGNSPAMALSQHDNDPQAAARGSSWC